VSNRPNDAQRADFAAYLRKWQERLGLIDWRVEPAKKSTKAMASVSTDIQARLACWRLGDFGGAEINAHSLETTALHEMLHVLLAELVHAASTNAQTLESAEHRVVNLLEKILCPEPDSSQEKV
jgi:hypothetical protein